MLNDNDIEMVRYMHPNRGQHPVYGLATKKFYGMRSGGGTEAFLVHRADIAAAPHYFHIIAAAPTPPKKDVPAPPPPARLKDVPAPTREFLIDVEDKINLADAGSSNKVEFEIPEGAIVRDDGMIEVPQEPDPLKRALDHARFDLQLLPGATPEIVRRLADHNLNSVEKILNGGVAVLKEVKGIGNIRAAIIYGYVKENFG